MEKAIMKLVVKKASRAGFPFFSAIAKGDKIIASSKGNGIRDPTAHAEMLAIQKALRKLKTNSLKGFTLYSTCESCPMCMGAIHWAGISELVFGARLTDSRRFGFDEIIIPQVGATLKRRGVKINNDVMRKECIGLFKSSRW
ncbi:MAG: nucleoside deaminase [Candidatus Micrarchaeota archaeon]|nr:nucleoside deaminase [Candidatus Micrarchaeota archaeon]